MLNVLMSSWQWTLPLCGDQVVRVRFLSASPSTPRWDLADESIAYRRSCVKGFWFPIDDFDTLSLSWYTGVAEQQGSERALVSTQQAIQSVAHDNPSRDPLPPLWRSG